LSQPILEIRNLSKRYRLGSETVHALSDITLSVDAGVFMAIAGPSGSGKSTLLNMIGLIDTPSAGSLKINSVEMTLGTPDSLAKIRAQTVGFIFQTFNLLPVLTAYENVEYPLLQFPEISVERRNNRVKTALDVVGLAEHMRHRPDQLSGGQRQRVAIARALVTKPQIVLADEPTANLDHKTGTAILKLMKHINRQYGTTFIFSTHDKRVMNAADRIEDGAIELLGVREGAHWSFVNVKKPDEHTIVTLSDAVTP
jgi:putative ABC transport system ATP-binding protein